jgi:hypothetical protein
LLSKYPEEDMPKNEDLPQSPTKAPKYKTADEKVTATLSHCVEGVRYKLTDISNNTKNYFDTQKAI